VNICFGVWIAPWRGFVLEFALNNKIIYSLSEHDAFKLYLLVCEQSRNDVAWRSYWQRLAEEMMEAIMRAYGSPDYGDELRRDG
jgi:hypothetical protein